MLQLRISWLLVVCGGWWLLPDTRESERERGGKNGPSLTFCEFECTGEETFNIWRLKIVQLTCTSTSSECSSALVLLNKPCVCSPRWPDKAWQNSLCSLWPATWVLISSLYELSVTLIESCYGCMRYVQKYKNSKSLWPPSFHLPGRPSSAAQAALDLQVQPNVVFVNCINKL